MAKVDDLLEKRAKQVVLAIVARLAHRSPPTANLAVEGITDHPNRESQTARKPTRIPGFLAKSITCSGQIIAIDQTSEFFTDDYLFSCSRRRRSIISAICSCSSAIFSKPFARRRAARARCHFGDSSRDFSRSSSVDIFGLLRMWRGALSVNLPQTVIKLASHPFDL